MSWVKHWIYLELDLERNSRCNSGRLWREQQAGKAWLSTHLNYIILIRSGVGGTDKRTTEYRGSMSDQLIVFSSGVFVTVCKGWYLREAIQWWSREILWSFYNNQHYFTRAAYNSTFIYNLYLWLPLLKPLAYNWELVYYCFACSSMQFSFAPL